MNKHPVKHSAKKLRKAASRRETGPSLKELLEKKFCIEIVEHASEDEYSQSRYVVWIKSPTGVKRIWCQNWLKTLLDVNTFIFACMGKVSISTMHKVESLFSDKQLREMRVQLLRVVNPQEHNDPNWIWGIHVYK
jgi:hypothetical protein